MLIAVLSFHLLQKDKLRSSDFATVILLISKTKNSTDYDKFAMGVWRRGAALMSVPESVGLYFNLDIIFKSMKQ